MAATAGGRFPLSVPCAVTASRYAQARNPVASANMIMLSAALQMRHPLALAHFANHPSKGSKPNVMAAAFDFAAQPGRVPLAICMHKIKCDGT